MFVGAVFVGAVFVGAVFVGAVFVGAVFVGARTIGGAVGCGGAVGVRFGIYPYFNKSGLLNYTTYYHLFYTMY